nr:thyX: thymidylate synthase [uncultured bacterium]
MSAFNEFLFRDDMTVTLIDSMGSDERICQAARVSTEGSASFQTGEAAGLINFLARERHGSPFEHVVFQWLIEAPIFVWREFMRHRVASYNEESGRYKALQPVFYMPNTDRKLVQIGKTGNYDFVDGSADQFDLVEDAIFSGSIAAYNDYSRMLDEGIAKEVARMVLPVNIYSSAYVTMNLRAAFNFLSLRNKVEGATYPTHPQREIEMVAELMEEDVARVAPLAYAAFNKNGRVSP